MVGTIYIMEDEGTRDRKLVVLHRTHKSILILLWFLDREKSLSHLSIPNLVVRMATKFYDNSLPGGNFFCSTRTNRDSSYVCIKQHACKSILTTTTTTKQTLMRNVSRSPIITGEKKQTRFVPSDT